jgi:hypothetical protein
MKAKTLLLSAIFGTLASFSFAQNQATVWAQITEVNAIPSMTADGKLSSANPALNAAISNVNIVSIAKALPASKSEKLQRVYAFTCTCEESELKNSLKEVSVVSGIENAPNYQALYSTNDFNLMVPTDYALNLIQAQGAWDVTHGSSSFVIGISDQNITPNHEELAGKIVHYDASNTATPSHGNAVSIIAAGNTDNNQGLSAIGFNSSIAFYQMNYNEILLASYAGIDVINISWTSGCFYNQYEQDVMTEIYDNGTFAVAAAGNGNTCGTPDALVYPAAYAHVFSVTSIGQADNHEQTAGDPNTTHQHNNMVDLSAPGYDVAIAPMSGWYLASSGTSYAAPFVTGTIALMLTANPCLTNNDIETILKNSSNNIDFLNPGYAGKIGAGRLNAANAVSMAQSFTNHGIFNASVVGLCQSSTASITLNPSQLQGPFNVSWSNGMTGLQNDGLASGTYTLSLTDAHGCTADTNILINTATPLQLNATLTHVQCFGQSNGAIDVTITQGTPNYNYSWDNGANTQDLTNLIAGTYRLTMMDGNGCTAYESFEVLQPTQLNLSTTVSDVTTNNNGSIDVTVTGGVPVYQYAWSNGINTEDLTNLSAGVYNVTLFDANGCTSTTQVTVLDLTVSGINENQNDAVSIYPNPSNGNATVTWTGTMTEIYIKDAQGKVVANEQVIGQGTYNISQNATGVYLVTLVNDKGNTTTKRIVVM